MPEEIKSPPNEYQPTEEQRIAITTPDRTILLSAAAGSGKTKVLTERIIRMVCDDDPPLDIDRLIAVTFTRAAATEMQERISKALTKRVKKNFQNKHMLRQLRRLPLAKICTIDAFCNELVKQNAEQAGVVDGYRMADPQETDLARISILDDVIRDAYAGLIPELTQETFCAFVTRMYAMRNERRITETLLELFSRLETLEDGFDVLASDINAHLEDAEKPVMKTRWGVYLRTICMADGAHVLACWNEAFRKEPPSPEAEARFDHFLGMHRGVLNALVDPDISYTELREYVLSQMPDVRDTKLAKLPTAIRNVCKTLREKQSKLVNYFQYTADQWAKMFHDLAHHTSCLLALAREFEKRESAESRRRGVFSFSQIERLAYSLLKKDGQKTPLAISLSQSYDAVFVDEYQDVSPIQHAVFEAISTDRSRFLVGDIKQSIYRFRHADPSIFASLRRAFPPLDEAPDSPRVSLFMSRNFRSDPTIINYVNHVFDMVFGLAGESIGYIPGSSDEEQRDGEKPTKSDRLTCGKRLLPDAKTHLPVLAVFSGEKGIRAVADNAPTNDGLPESEYVAGGEKNPLPSSNMPEPTDEGIHREALWIASRIRDLIDNATLHDKKKSDESIPVPRRVDYDDIIILLRSKKSKVFPYIAALEKYGIPVETTESTDFFTCPEVLLALSLMRTVDNPRRDVPLSAVLLSPLYRLTADDLLLIRRESPEGIPLYDSLVAYCGTHPDFDRGHFFLAQLTSFRDIAEGISVDRLLYRLLTQTPLLAIAGNNGRDRLRLLYYYSLHFASNEEGLYNFICYIDRQIETGKTFSPPATGSTNVVRIMSIHKSKGLEAPVIFLADCAKMHSNLDSMDHYVFDGIHPVVYHLRDESGLVRQKSPARALATRSIAEQNAEEEMRLLYVALTRAQEYLFVSGTLPGVTKASSAIENAAKKAPYVTGYDIRSCNNYLSLLLLAAERHPEGVVLCADPEIASPEIIANEELSPFRDAENIDSLVNEYERRFRFLYPHAHLSRVPAKLSVSDLNERLLNNAPVEATQDEDRAKKYRRMPEAYAGVRPPDPTERGIASHLFMQFCDFARLRDEGVEAERKRLLDLRFMSKKDDALMRLDELEKFRKSKLLSDMCQADRVLREFRFHVRLDAREFTTEEQTAEALGEQTLLVQGVIDALIFARDGSVTLVDYKTDRLDKEELKNPEKAAEKLTRRHAPQLKYYAAAVKQIFGQKPARILLYSLQLGDSIELHLDE